MLEPVRFSLRDTSPLVAEGLKTADIAHRLYYSERTVKSVVSTACRRLGLANRTRAMAHAPRAGLM